MHRSIARRAALVVVGLLGSGACSAGGHELEPGHPHQQHAGLGHAERPGRVRSRQRPAHVLGLPEHAQLQGARRRHRGGQRTRPAPSYGKYLTPDQFRARYAPTDADVAAVRSLLEAVRLHRHRRPARQQPLGQGQRHDGAGRAGVQHAAAHLPAPRQDAAGAQRRPQHRALDLEPHRRHRRPRRQRPAHEARHRRRASGAGLRQRAAVLDLVGRAARRRRQGQPDRPARLRPAFLPYATCGYTPNQLQGAYGTKAAVAGGLDGHGQTVAIVDAFASPTIEQDADQYATTHGQPAVDFSQITPEDRSNDPIGGPTSATRRAGTARRPSTSRPCTRWRPAPMCSSWAAPTASTSR